jgi:hypothetical protein
MRTPKQPEPIADVQTNPLAAAVDRLTDEVSVLRHALDEFREIFTWAVRSDRLRSGHHEADGPDSDISADHSETEQNDEQHDNIVAAVQDGLNDVCADLEEAVRDQLKQELAGFRDSLDQFSIDITWAVRQIRVAADGVKTMQSSDSSDPVAQSEADNLGDKETVDLPRIAPKTFSGSSVISQAAQLAGREDSPPGEKGQGSLFK